MIEAFVQTALDLFLGFLIASCIFSVAYCTLRVAGKRNAERQQREFDRAISRELAGLEQELPEYLRVTGGACSGPEPTRTRSR